MDLDTSEPQQHLLYPSNVDFYPSNVDFLRGTGKEPANSGEIAWNIERQVQKRRMPKSAFGFVFLYSSVFALFSTVAGIILVANGVSYTALALSNQNLIEVLNGCGRIILGLVIILWIARTLLQTLYHLVLIQLVPSAPDYYYRRLVNARRIVLGHVTAVTASESRGTLVYFRVDQDGRTSDHQFTTFAERSINPNDSVVVAYTGEIYILL